MPNWPLTPLCHIFKSPCVSAPKCGCGPSPNLHARRLQGQQPLPLTKNPDFEDCGKVGYQAIRLVNQIDSTCCHQQTRPVHRQGNQRCGAEKSNNSGLWKIDCQTGSLIDNRLPSAHCSHDNEKNQPFEKILYIYISRGEIPASKMWVYWRNKIWVQIYS